MTSLIGRLNDEKTASAVFLCAIQRMTASCGAHKPVNIKWGLCAYGFDMERKSFMTQHSDRRQVEEVGEAIAASRNDPRPAVAADIVFAELYSIIDRIASEQSNLPGDNCSSL